MRFLSLKKIITFKKIYLQNCVLRLLYIWQDQILNANKKIKWNQFLSDILLIAVSIFPFWVDVLFDFWVYNDMVSWMLYIWNGFFFYMKYFLLSSQYYIVQMHHLNKWIYHLNKWIYSYQRLKIMFFIFVFS